jgi:hypothetical protein
MRKVGATIFKLPLFNVHVGLLYGFQNYFGHFEWPDKGFVFFITSSLSCLCRFPGKSGNTMMLKIGQILFHIILDSTQKFSVGFKMKCAFLTLAWTKKKKRMLKLKYISCVMPINYDWNPTGQKRAAKCVM